MRPMLHVAVRDCGNQSLQWWRPSALHKATGIRTQYLNCATSLDCNTEICILIPLFVWVTHKFEFLGGETLTKWNIKVYNLGADQKASSTTFDVTIYIQSLIITGTSWVRISTIGTLFRKRGFVFFISPCNQSRPQPLLSTLFQFITCVIYPTLLAYREFIWKKLLQTREFRVCFSRMTGTIVLKMLISVELLSLYLNFRGNSVKEKLFLV